MYRIRRVDGFDEEIADTLRSLHDEIFGDTAPQIDPENGWWWIGTDGRELAGFCGLTPTYADANLGYFSRVGVRVLHRGAGLQRRFTRVLEAQARRVGMRAIVSDTTDNPPSANNMIACGYRIYEPPHPWAFRHSIYWYKKL